MQNRWKSLTVIMLLIMAAFSSSVVFAGGADPVAAPAPAPEVEPVADARICGEEGAVTQSSTNRWTNIFATAHPDSDTGRAYEPNTPVTITGRDYWGCWVAVEAEPGNGWIPVDATTTKAVMGLPVLVDNSDTPPGGPAPAAPAPAAPPAGDAGCVIPASGPWPPCATGGNAAPAAPAPPAGNGECVIPASGPWPPCATAGNAAPAAPNGRVALNVVNNSSITICEIHISPVTADYWGGDWTGVDSLASGASRSFDVEPGMYDLGARDCNGDLVADRFNVDITDGLEWTLSDQ